MKPPVSEFGTVDPAPPAAQTDVSALRRTLLDPRTPLFERFRALFGLRNLDSDAAALALGQGLLSDPSALVRHECAYVLGQLQRAVVVAHLTRALERDSSPMVRHEAAEALGAIGTPDVIPLLRRFLEDPVVEVRESCELALAHIKYLRDPGSL